MSFNTSPSAERLHIGFFGMRNAGKSSLVNAVTNQQLSVVSDIKGTTTDPVKKAMELLPVGPVVIIDTPGFDDEGELGLKRVKKAEEILRKTDFAVLVVDLQKGLSEGDNNLLSMFEESKVPYLIAYNKADICSSDVELKHNEIAVSAVSGYNINNLKEKIAVLTKGIKKDRPIIDDLIKKGDTVILVTPIDESAPKGRLILPQQITLRNILDNDCTAIVCKETDLESTIKSLSVRPSLVITDSQVFSYVNNILEKDIRLTSFSIIFARYKGDLETLVKGAYTLENLKNGDKILISEGCTHHRQCNDIGTVKMPGWIIDYTNKSLDFTFTSGGDFPENLADFRLVVHCGGCMLGEKEMSSRMERCKSAGVPMVNYGVVIAAMNGILKRALAVFENATETRDE